MDLKISFRHLDHSDGIEEKIKEKASRLSKYFHGHFNVDWTCDMDGDVHKSEVHVIGDHLSLHASSKKDNMYKTIDDALEKIEKQMSKKDNLVKDKMHRATL